MRTIQNGISIDFRCPDENRSTAMMSIVCCASFIPCPNENAAAETSCTLPSALSSGSGLARRKIHVALRKKRKPRSMPSVGERTMKTRVLTRPFATRTPGPAFTTAAPAKPPPPRQEVPDDRAEERREDEERVHDGRIHDVLADRLGDAGLERERGDEVEERGPRDGRLRRQDAGPDDGRDRIRGVVEAVDEVERERDEDDEEDERHRRPALRGLQDDLLEDVRDVLAAVGRFLEDLVDLLPLQERARVLLRVEERADRDPVQAVGLVLETVDLDADLENGLPVLEVPEEAHRAADRVRGLDENLRRLLDAGPGRRDLVEDEAVRGGVHEVEDVVERLDEGVDVLAVDGRDPRAREEAERLVRDLVALVLEVLDPGDLERDVREVSRERVERPRRLHDDVRRADELRDEGLLAGKQLDHGA